MSAARKIGAQMSRMICVDLQRAGGATMSGILNARAVWAVFPTQEAADAVARWALFEGLNVYNPGVSRGRPDRLALHIGERA